MGKYIPKQIYNPLSPNPSVGNFSMILTEKMLFLDTLQMNYLKNSTKIWQNKFRDLYSAEK